MKTDTMIERLRARGPQLLDRFRAEALYLFISAARGEMTAAVDFDLLVDFTPPTDFDRYVGLKSNLEDLPECRVDLVTLKALCPELKDRIESEAIRVA